MVDSLPPSGTSGTDPDNETIMTNSNGKLSVPLDGTTLDVGSSGKVKLFEARKYLANFDQDSGDWTGIDSVSDGIATVNVGFESTASASVTADLTDIDVLNFRVRAGACSLAIEFDGIELVSRDATHDFVTVEISGLDNYDFGTNSTLMLEVYYRYDSYGSFYIDYVRGLIQPESRKVELVDTGGL